MARTLVSNDLAVLRRGADHPERVDAAEVVGRLIAWLLDPAIRAQVNALTVGELTINVGADDLSGHARERVVVVISRSHSARA